MTKSENFQVFRFCHLNWDCLTTCHIFCSDFVIQLNTHQSEQKKLLYKSYKHRVSIFKITLNSGSQLCKQYTQSNHNKQQIIQRIGIQHSRISTVITDFFLNEVTFRRSCLLVFVFCILFYFGVYGMSSIKVTNSYATYRSYIPW